MKILVISQYYYPEQFRITEICEQLVVQGHDITVLAGIPNYPEGEIFKGYEESYKSIENHNGVKIIRCNNRPRYTGGFNLLRNYLSFVMCANRMIKKISDSFDAIYVYQLSPVIMAIPAIKYKKKKHIPLYVYCLDIWPESVKEYCEGKMLSERNPIFLLIKSISSRIYTQADSIGVTSASFVKYLVEVCGVKRRRIHYLPQHSDDVTAGLDLTVEENGCIDIFFMGNLGIAQNTKQIVDAVEQIKDIKNYKMHIVGAGSMLSDMKERVQEKHLEDKFVFYGKRPYSEMTKYYKQADACLLTLSGKTKTGLTIPGKLQNYMSAGKPIIAAIDGDAAELIKAANCGICVSADDESELARAIKEFVIHQSEYKNCGTNARKYYEENFTIEKYVSELENQLLKLVQQEK